MNGLRIDIQYEINLLSPRTMEEAYQCALKDEEKIMRKQNSGRGCGTKGKMQTAGRGKFSAHKNDSRTSNQQEQSDKRNDFIGGRTSQRAGGRGRGRENGYICYKCNKLGHRSFECPENEKTRQRGVHIEKGEVQPPMAKNVAETRESLMMNKFLLNPKKEEIEPMQRKTSFRTISKSKGKCFQVVIDSGSTNNLIATEMVEMLGLKKMKHPTPFKVSSPHKGHHILMNE